MVFFSHNRTKQLTVMGNQRKGQPADNRRSYVGPYLGRRGSQGYPPDLMPNGDDDDLGYAPHDLLEHHRIADRLGTYEFHTTFRPNEPPRRDRRYPG